MPKEIELPRETKFAIYTEGDATVQEPGNYCGFFESSEGCLWLFVYDDNTNTATLREGANWDCVYPVIEGKVQFDAVHGEFVIRDLDEDEQQWLRLCWAAAVTTQKHRPRCS